MGKLGKLVEERRLKKSTYRRTMKAPGRPRKDRCVHKGLTRARGMSWA